MTVLLTHSSYTVFSHLMSQMKAQRRNHSVVGMVGLEDRKESGYRLTNLSSNSQSTAMWRSGSEVKPLQQDQ